MAFLSPWGGVGRPSLLLRSFLLPCTTSRALAGPGRPQPLPSPATRMKPQPCLVCWRGEFLGWGGRRTGRQGGGQGQTGRSGKLCRKKGDMPAFRLEKSHWLIPTSSAPPAQPVPLSQSLWAARGRERRGAGLERNSQAAQECQASRSPAALRLMAPVRSQEQPGARSPGAETPPGRPPPLAPPLPAPRNLPSDFLSVADSVAPPQPTLSYRMPPFCLLPATHPPDSQGLHQGLLPPCPPPPPPPSQGPKVIATSLGSARPSLPPAQPPPPIPPVLPSPSRCPRQPSLRKEEVLPARAQSSSCSPTSGQPLLSRPLTHSRLPPSHPHQDTCHPHPISLEVPKHHYSTVGTY